jgi:hypothetical protein
MSWEIIYSSEFETWFVNLDQDSAKAIARSVGILRELGPMLGRPHVDTLKGSRIKNLKELRTQCKHRAFRTMFVFDPARNAVVLIGGDKTGEKRFYEKIIPQAEEIYSDYLRRFSHEKKRI